MVLRDMRRAVVLVPLVLAALGGCTSAQAEGAASAGGETPMIRYHLTFEEAREHRVHVRMTVPEAPAGGFEVAMPVWTPGSYLVREFARNVSDLSAADARGVALPVAKRDKNTWRVETAAAGAVTLDYTLYANERSVRTSHVDDGHAFLSPAATFLFVRGGERQPHAVSVAAPPGWEVFTGLRRDGGGWLAPDYDTLVDSPLEIGPHRVLTFEVQGVPFRVVLAGEGALDETALQDDAQKVAAEVASIFGRMPFDDYTFLVELVDNGGGGLEHRNSCVCMTSRWSLNQKKEYRRFLDLLAHEFFHAWNVKRFRPAALGPFDWDRENYTRDLWVAEGITSYYDDLSIVRAGFADKVTEYLERLGQGFREIAELPGARRMSLSQASMDAWIKYYRPDENSRNTSVSYYTKGGLVALMLDLRIRRLSGGRATLADALRLGWKRYTERGEGYPDGAMLALASEAAGSDLAAFFAAYVDGTEELRPDEDLAWVGLRLGSEPAKAERDLPRDAEGYLLSPELGALTADDAGLCKLTAVLEGGAAFEAGLNVNDLILAVDGMRVTNATLQDRLDRTRGEPVEIVFYRGQALRTLTARPRLQRLAEWKLLPVEAATARQQEAFKAWCGWDFPARSEPANGKDAAAGTRRDADPGAPAGPAPATAPTEPATSSEPAAAPRARR